MGSIAHERTDLLFICHFQNPELHHFFKMKVRVKFSALEPPDEINSDVLLYKPTCLSSPSKKNYEIANSKQEIGKVESIFFVQFQTA